MKTSTRTLTSILAAALALGVAGSALAQPHRDDRPDDRRDDHRDDHREVAPPGAAVAPPAGRVVVAPPADPRVAERLHQLEDQRRKERLNAIKDVKTWNAARPQRALTHRGEIASTWGNIVTTPEAQAELKLHADRMARLNRILDISPALTERCQRDIQTEVDRDARVMQEIRARGGR
jgi:hypothetical protein